MAKKRIDIGIEGMVKRLSSLEKIQDGLLVKSREIIRNCANSIKCMHNGENEKACEFLKMAGDGLKKAREGAGELSYLLRQSEQEVVEAEVLFAIMGRKGIPKAGDLGVEEPNYLTGICDCIGELRRQMLEELRKGRVKEAQYYFEIMEALNEEMSALRFSNSLLPNFRAKQDVVRGQLERARSEIVWAVKCTPK